jgi:hypothetical protein
MFMRSHLRRKVKRLFAAAVAELDPPFAPLDDATGQASERDTLFRWEQPGTPVFFLFLQLAENNNSFTIEAAWSARGLFPWSMLCRQPVDRPQSDILKEPEIDKEYRFRVGAFFGHQGDHWWNIADDEARFARLMQADVPPDEVIELMTCDPVTRPGQVEQAVQDAVSKLRSYVLPLFHARIASNP